MTYNVPVRHLQQGSVIEAGPSGTVLIASGGSIQVASGGAVTNAGVQSFASGGSLIIASGANINVAAAAGLTAPLGITVGGTAGRWAFGTTGLTSGLGTRATGLTRVVAATGNVIAGEASGLGSTTTVQVDLSLSAAGSVIFRTSIGTLPAAVDGTISWMAFGT